MRATRTTATLLLAAAALVPLAACSSNSKVSGVASAAASAAQSAAQSAGAGALASASAAASSAMASASAAVSSALASATAGLDVKKDVTVSEPTPAADGKMSATVKVTNPTGKQASFLITVSFRDASGNVLDAVATTVKDVPAGGTGTATVTSHRTLTGTVKTQVETAVRD
jgi:hypothetical protein